MTREEVGMNIEKYLENLTRRAPMSDSALTKSQDQLGIKLPNDYLELLSVTNGGEGFIGKNSYVILWGVEELATMNQSYQVQEYAPGLLIFGSDGGGEAYGFDTRMQLWHIVQVPFVGMDWALAQPVGKSVGDFLKHLYEAG